jgi:hypothetical protein
MSSLKENGPVRLRDGDPSPLERALLDAGTSYPSSASAKAKTLAALGLVGSAAVAASASAASASAASAASTASGLVTGAAKVSVQLTLAKALMAVTAVGAVTAAPFGYYEWRQHRAAVESRSAATATATAPAPARAPVAAPIEQELAPPPAETQLRPRHRATAPERAAVSSPRLRKELAALDAVREALAGNDFVLALDLLDRYERVHPRGGLALEAEVLRIDALVKAGRRDLARRRAEAFVRRHPDTVLTGRVRDFLGD